MPTFLSPTNYDAIRSAVRDPNKIKATTEKKADGLGAQGGLSTAAPNMSTQSGPVSVAPSGRMNVPASYPNRGSSRRSRPSSRARGGNVTPAPGMSPAPTSKQNKARKITSRNQSVPGDAQNKIPNRYAPTPLTAQTANRAAVMQNRYSGIGYEPSRYAPRPKSANYRPTPNGVVEPVYRPTGVYGLGRKYTTMGAQFFRDLKEGRSTTRGRLSRIQAENLGVTAIGGASLGAAVGAESLLLGSGKAAGSVFSRFGPELAAGGALAASKTAEYYGRVKAGELPKNARYDVLSKTAEQAAVFGGGFGAGRNIARSSLSGITMRPNFEYVSKRVTVPDKFINPKTGKPSRTMDVTAARGAIVRTDFLKNQQVTRFESVTYRDVNSGETMIAERVGNKDMFRNVNIPKIFSDQTRSKGFRTVTMAAKEESPGRIVDTVMRGTGRSVKGSNRVLVRNVRYGSRMRGGFKDLIEEKTLLAATNRFNERTGYMLQTGTRGKLETVFKPESTGKAAPDIGRAEPFVSIPKTSTGIRSQILPPFNVIGSPNIRVSQKTRAAVVPTFDVNLNIGTSPDIINTPKQAVDHISITRPIEGVSRSKVNDIYTVPGPGVFETLRPKKPTFPVIGGFGFPNFNGSKRKGYGFGPSSHRRATLNLPSLTATFEKGFNPKKAEKKIKGKFFTGIEIRGL